MNAGDYHRRFVLKPLNYADDRKIIKMEDNTSTIPNVYRYDSPAIYSSEQLNTIKKLVGFIESHKDDNEQQPIYEARNTILTYCRFANIQCTFDLFHKFPDMNKQIFQAVCEDFHNWRDDFILQIAPDELRELHNIKNFEYLRCFIYQSSCTKLSQIQYGIEWADAKMQQHLNAFKLLMQSDVFSDVYQILQQNGKETLASGKDPIEWEHITSHTGWSPNSIMLENGVYLLDILNLNHEQHFEQVWQIIKDKFALNDLPSSTFRYLMKLDSYFQYNKNYDLTEIFEEYLPAYGQHCVWLDCPPFFKHLQNSSSFLLDLTNQNIQKELKAYFAKVTKEDFDLMCKIIVHLTENNRLTGESTEQSVVEAYRDELTAYVATNNNESAKRMLETDYLRQRAQDIKTKPKLKI